MVNFLYIHDSFNYITNGHRASKSVKSANQFKLTVGNPFLCSLNEMLLTEGQDLSYEYVSVRLISKYNSSR